MIEKEQEGERHGEKQSKERAPFLVNRKDKFLRHIKEEHEIWSLVSVMQKSKVNWRGKVEDCNMCGEKLKTWESRCTHMIDHFEKNDRDVDKNVQTDDKDKPEPSTTQSASGDLEDKEGE